MDDCLKQISNCRPWWSPSGAHRSDINKKSQLTALFTGLMSLCEVSHLSGVKAVMASMCVCVCEREEIRALKDLRSLCVELLIDRPNVICLLISSRIWREWIFSGWWFRWLSLRRCTLMLPGYNRRLCFQCSLEVSRLKLGYILLKSKRVLDVQVTYNCCFNCI